MEGEEAWDIYSIFCGKGGPGRLFRGNYVKRCPCNVHGEMVTALDTLTNSIACLDSLGSEKRRHAPEQRVQPVHDQQHLDSH